MAAVQKLPPSSSMSFTYSKPCCVSLDMQRISVDTRISLASSSSSWFDGGISLRSERFVVLASVEGEAFETRKEEASGLAPLLQSYKEALANEDESKVSEIETIFTSFVTEKDEFQRKLVAVTDELSAAKTWIHKISAEYQRFRTNAEGERIVLVKNSKGELFEKLLALLNDFESTKAQIEVKTEGEEKIGKSYQSIFKQFVEVLGSLDVLPNETPGKPSDPSAEDGNRMSVRRLRKEIVAWFRTNFKKAFVFFETAE